VRWRHGLWRGASARPCLPVQGVEFARTNGTSATFDMEVKTSSMVGA